MMQESHKLHGLFGRMWMATLVQWTARIITKDPDHPWKFPLLQRHTHYGTHRYYKSVMREIGYQNVRAETSLAFWNGVTIHRYQNQNNLVKKLQGGFETQGSNDAPSGTCLQKLQMLTPKINPPLTTHPSCWSTIPVAANTTETSPATKEENSSRLDALLFAYASILHSSAMKPGWSSENISMPVCTLQAIRSTVSGVMPSSGVDSVYHNRKIFWGHF